MRKIIEGEARETAPRTIIASDAGGGEPLFLDFRQISSKMARRLDRKISSRELVRDKKGKERKEEHARAINPFIPSATL